MAQLNFDARTVDPNVSLEPVPAGWYTVQIVRSETKPTSNREGSFLELEMDILDGQYKGRKLFDRLNLVNKNDTAVEIAFRTLSSICHATGIIQIQDSAQLHNIPFEARTTVRLDQTGQYDPSNEMRGYRALNGGAGAGAAGAMPPGATPPGAMQQMPPQGFKQPPAIQPPAQQWQQPPAQQQPPQGWQQPPVEQPAAQQQPAPQPMLQTFAQVAEQSPPQYQQPEPQQQQPAQQPWQQQTQPAQQQVQQPAMQQQQPAPADAGGVPAGAPVGGNAPSANNSPDVPPWGQQPAQS